MIARQRALRHYHAPKAHLHLPPLYRQAASTISYCTSDADNSDSHRSDDSLQNSFTAWGIDIAGYLLIHSQSLAGFAACKRYLRSRDKDMEEIEGSLVEYSR